MTQSQAKRVSVARADETSDIDELVALLSPDRVDRFRLAVARRMKGLTVVLEDLYDPGNQSAVFRTAEALGVLNVHVVKPEGARKGNARKVSRGSEKWLRIVEHDSATAGVAALHASGYAVYAAHLGAACPIESIDFSRPTALVFGNEHDGVSDEMVAVCDGSFVLPMRGLSDSFNISVAAGIGLHAARIARERALGDYGDLDAAERNALFAHYITVSARWLHRRKSERHQLQQSFPVLEPRRVDLR